MPAAQNIRLAQKFKMFKLLLVKIHTSYRKIVAVCDAELLGKRFEQGKMQLEVRKEFYGGERKTEREVVKLLQEEEREDATFNLVGTKAVNAGIKAGVINKEGVLRIRGIPNALSLL